MKMAAYESVVLVKPEVFVYNIPPLSSTNRAARAADWNLSTPDWSGRLRVVALGEKCTIKLEDKVSGELFAACPVEEFPGIAVQPVSDSSRYFVIRLKDSGNRQALVGLGFQDRGDSFDFNVALQDHFKWLKKSKDFEKTSNEPIAQKDFSLKEGQTITVNIGTSSVKPKSKPQQGNTIGFLPPPPGSMPSTRNKATSSQTTTQDVSNADDWTDFLSRYFTCQCGLLSI
jgi:hypothetical protein